MAIIYSWIVEQLDCYPEHDDHVNVVSVAHWRYAATDETNTTSVYGTVNISFEASEPFTPFEQLTQPQVISWVHDALGTAKIDALTDTLNLQLQNMIQPTIVSPPLPWGS